MIQLSLRYILRYHTFMLTPQPLRLSLSVHQPQSFCVTELARSKPMQLIRPGQKVSIMSVSLLLSGKFHFSSRLSENASVLRKTFFFLIVLVFCSFSLTPLICGVFFKRKSFLQESRKNKIEIMLLHTLTHYTCSTAH